MKTNKKSINKIDEIKGVIDTNSIESIYPFVMKETKDTMETGGNYNRVIVFAAYPDEAKGNWLSDLKRLKGNISITQYVEPANTSHMIEYYNSAIKNKNAELEKTFDPKQTIMLKKEIESASYQLKQTLENKSGYVYIYTYVLIQAETMKELQMLEEKVMMVLSKLHIKGIVPYYRMLDAYMSTLPIFENRLKEFTYQMSNTTAASSFFLYDDNEICNLDPGAIIEGINKKTNSLISINYNDHTKTINRNMLVTGTSGTGKSTYLKNKILTQIAQGNQIYILDPENEYTFIVKHFGGTVIHFSSSSNTKINPLEFFSTEMTDDNIDEERNNNEVIGCLIKQKIQRLKGFFKIIKEDIAQVELSVIEVLLNRLYKRIYEIDLNSIKHTDFPILEDLYRECETLKEEDNEKFQIIKDFYYILYSFVYGSNSVFNGYTNIELEASLVTFELSALRNEKAVQGACYYNLFTYLWDEITKRNNGLGEDESVTYLYADEFHFLLTNEECCDFFFQAYKRFRKYNAGCIVATQQIVDVLNSKFSNSTSGDVGTAITENSFTKVFFGLDNKGVNDVIEKLAIKFSKKEVSLLRAKVQGEALLMYGTKRAFMKVNLTKEKLRLLNPSEYQRIYQEDPHTQPDYRKEFYISPLEKEEILNFGGGR